MRLISLAGTLFAIGLFIYAFASFAMVSAVITPSAPKPEVKILPLAEAAPEVAKLRPAFGQLAAKAKEMVPFCPNRDDESEPARPRGKVLVWDVEKKDVSEAHGRLPAELRLQSPDEPCTVYLITGRERRAVMNYNFDIFHGGGSAGVQGFRTDLFVCAVDLPSLQPRGRYRINGNGPPQLVELKQGVREIDEDWAGNLKRFIEICVHGPEARHYNLGQQPEVRCADQARTVIEQCEMLGSLPTLTNLPREVTVWNPQTDRWHPAHGPLRNKADGDKPLLMVMVLDDEFVHERVTGRFDYRVALVRFPGAQPLGVYRVRGESWPWPKQGESWGSTEGSSRQPYAALANWANHFCEGKRGLPPKTIPVAPDAIHLSGSDWLKGPGWTKYVSIGPVAPELQEWEKMAKECEPKIDECRRKGSPADIGKLPKKIVIWTAAGDCFLHNPAQRALPKAMQATPRDRDVLMAMIVGNEVERLPKNAPKTERTIHEIALFTMPGARPIGVYRIVGDQIDANWTAMGSDGPKPNPQKEISEWLKRFADSPQTVAKQSTVR